MKIYDISEDVVKETIKNPTAIAESYNERRIYQKKLNGYILRVVVEENKRVKIVVTIYKSKSGRYGL